MRMTKRQLAQYVSKLEGKKSQVSFGNIMEVLNVLEKIFVNEYVYASENDLSNSMLISFLEGIEEKAEKKIAKNKKSKKK